MRVIPALIVAALSVGAHAGVYTWKDASGKTIYSDQPPPKMSQGREVKGSPAISSDAEEQRKALAEREMAARKQQKSAKEQAEKDEKTKATAEEQRVNCERARTNLQSIESGQTRFATNPKGEREALDGAARERELGTARKQVADWCK